MTKPTQLIFDLPHDPAVSREDFIVAPSNLAAFELLTGWPDWPSSWLLLTGPEGSGKSHLLKVWQDLCGAPVLSASDLGKDDPADQVASGVLGIEDLGDSGMDERGLFHLLNAAKEIDASIVMTARQPAADWALTIPDLISRLRLATPIAIEEPDDSMLRAILIKHASDRQLQVEPHVVDYMLARMERSLAMAARLVAALDALALERKSRITRSIAGEVLERLEPGTRE